MNYMKRAVKPKAKHPGADPYGCDLPHAMDNRVNSATDFTGLMPYLPQSDAELQAYADLYHYPGGIDHTPEHDHSPLYPKSADYSQDRTDKTDYSELYPDVSSHT